MHLQAISRLYKIYTRRLVNYTLPIQQLAYQRAKQFLLSTTFMIPLTMHCGPLAPGVLRQSGRTLWRVRNAEGTQ
jgi:hypothetical protein